MIDEDIVRDLKNRNKERFIEIVDNYKKKIIALCYSYTEDCFEAEDLSQEVFVAFYKSIGRFRGDCSISTYLYKIAISKCMDFKRKKSLKAILTLNHEIKDKSYNIDDKLFIRQCIKNLPKGIKDSIVLYYYVGLSQKEIAEVLNISERAVEGRIYRGKQILKVQLKKEETYVCSRKEMI